MEITEKKQKDMYNKQKKYEKNPNFNLLRNDTGYGHNRQMKMSDS